MPSANEKHQEFEQNVWDHAADEFQAQFDERRDLTSAEINFLKLVHDWVTDPDEDTGVGYLRKALIANPERTALVLQICGLTRNKILTDLRGSANAKTLDIPSDFRRLALTNAWGAAGPYLRDRLHSVLGRMSKTASFDEALEALNQATWPGYIRQQRAKLSGHEAEYRLAVLLSSAGIPFVPEEKAENPLCRDAQIDGISFDIVVPNIHEPKIVVKSTVHTANIGQYGESKDHLEVTEAREWIERKFIKSPPILLAFIDGVGFRSNRAGLAGVLEKSDEFCQFKTLWKAVVIGCAQLNLGFKLALSEEDISSHNGFLERWSAGPNVVSLEMMESTEGWIQAGDGLILR